MHCSFVIAVGAGLLCSSAVAQNVRTAVPITTKIRNGGTLDWATGTWHRNGGQAATAPGVDVMYDNTCAWSGGAFYVLNERCWDQYEEGRIPSDDLSGDPFASLNPDTSQLCEVYFLAGFQYGYCTEEITPAQGGTDNVQTQIGFIEGPNVSGIGGDCMNAALAIGSANPPSGGGLGLPPANFGGPNDLFIDVVGLPGTNQVAPVACWLITIDLSNNANGGFAFAANGGNGSFQNDGTDFFNIFYGLRGTTLTLGASTTGFFAGGDPANATPGAGAFGVPQGADQFGPCGSGLDIQDASWVNIDGTPVGASTPSNCYAALPAGSNCYFFGGWPAALFSDAFMVMNSSGVCASSGGQDWSTYCTAKASSSGCLATLSGSGPTLVSGANNFTVTMSGAQGQRPGIFIGGKSGPSAIGFFGGTLCVQPPLKRGLIKFTGGVANTCTGSYNHLINDGNSFPPGGTGFDSGAGTSSWMQGWYRDPALMSPQGASFDIALSNGIALTWN